MSPDPKTLDQGTYKLQSKHFQISFCPCSSPFVLLLHFLRLSTCLPFPDSPALPFSTFLFLFLFLFLLLSLLLLILFPQTSTFPNPSISRLLLELQLAQVSHPFSFHSCFLSFLLPHPRDCPILSALTSSLPTPSVSLLNCWAGWEKLFLFFCKVFHQLKSRRCKPKKPKIPSSHSLNVTILIIHGSDF